MCFWKLTSQRNGNYFSEKVLVVITQFWKKRELKLKISIHFEIDVCSTRTTLKLEQCRKVEGLWCAPPFCHLPLSLLPSFLFPQGQKITQPKSPTMIDQLCFEALLPIVADSIIPQRENLFVVICLHCNHWTYITVSGDNTNAFTRTDRLWPKTFSSEWHKLIISIDFLLILVP